MTAALEGCQVAGTVTNLRFLSALCDHPGFAAGEVDTGLIGRDLDSLVSDPAPTTSHCALAALAALDLLGGDDDTGFTLWEPLAHHVALEFGGERIDTDIRSLGPDHHSVTIGDAVIEVKRNGGRWSLDGTPAPEVVLSGELITVFAEAGFGFTRIDPLDVATSAGTAGNVIEAPMPGLVKAVFAAPGQAVEEGDRLAVLEAMKMEHALLAARDGVVAEVLAEPGAQVEAGAALILLEEEET